jgi:magnesium transporter
VRRAGICPLVIAPLPLYAAAMTNTEILKANVPPEGSHRPPVGAVPGSLVADTNASPTRMMVIDYGPDHFDQCEITDPSHLQPFIDKQSVTWVDVTGFKNIELVRTLGEMLDIHPLCLADAVNIPQRAKTEAYPDYVFIVTHAPEVDEEFYSEQVSVLFGDHFVLTFQERPDDDLFKPLRERIKAGRGLIRRKGPAYLGYSIVDVITDTYFPVLDDIEDKLDAMEKRVLNNELEVLAEVYELRHVALDLRRSIESHRDALSTLMHIQVPFIPDEVRLYLRDCLDHALSQVNLANGLMDYVVSLRELLASEQAQRMNEVMKLLTVVSLIFMPITFIAGVYGMNFDRSKPGNMPELGMPYGYWICWAVMAIVVTVMIVMFKRKKWL